MTEPAVRTSRSKSALLFGVAIAGGAGWCVDLSVLWLLAVEAGAPTWLAAGCGYLVAGVVNFVINRIVFQARHGRAGRQTLRFVALVVVNAVLVALVLPLLSSALSSAVSNRDARLAVAKMITTVALLPFNTVVNHRWVFATR